MGYIDFPTLVIIIAAGLDLGLLGLFGWNPATTYLGSHIDLVYAIVGLSAAWQLTRQNFL